MKRWKLYFRYDHLPPHLQAVAKPFHDLAVAIIANPDNMRASREANYNLFGFINAASSADREEISACLNKLVDCMCALRECDPCDALRLLLEAKDCAVRAHLPDPAEPSGIPG